MKITTKTGDKGETGLFGAGRVSKGDLVIEVLGCLDELQAFLGLCKAFVGRRDDDSEKKEKWKIIEKIQDDLYRIMAWISGSGSDGGSGGSDGSGGSGGSGVGDDGKNHKFDVEKDVKRLEELIEKYETCTDELNGFIKPGENELSARFHVARTVCRRAERAFVRFMDEGVKLVIKRENAEAVSGGDEDKIVLKYLNRLSDLLFLMALLDNSA